MRGTAGVRAAARSAKSIRCCSLPDDRPGAKRTPAWASPESHAMAYATDDPSRLSPHERLTEIAALLARGFLRLRGVQRREAGALRECDPQYREARLGHDDAPCDE